MTPPHKIVYTHGGGRLGNQLIRCLHWISWAEQYPGEVEVLDFPFWRYARYFEGWGDFRGAVIPRRHTIADRIAKMYGVVPSRWCEQWERADRLPRWLQQFAHGRSGWQVIALNDVAGEQIDLDAPFFFAQVQQARITLCSGWEIAGWEALAERESELRALFQPATPFARRADEFLAPLRDRYDLLVGVLVRQTDYRRWQNGRFHFTTDAYAGWIRQLLDLHPARRVGVVLASDERQDPAKFESLPVHFTSGSVNAGGHWFESFAELSRCDIVLTPPSTFSAAAAFVGGVPLWPVSAAGQQLSFDQVRPASLAKAAVDPVLAIAVK